MRTLKRLVKKLLLLVLSERDLIKCSFVLKRAFRTAHLLVFVYCSITSRLFKKPLGGQYIQDSQDLRDSQSPRVVFSLTSFPARIATLHHTIFSLLRQSTPADEIAVFLSLEEFPRGFASLPRILRFLHTQHFIRLHFVEANYKSCNKLIHALKFYTQDICVTIDDDQLYERDMLRLLLDSYRKYPQCIHTHHADMPIRESSGAFAWRAVS